MPKIIDFQIPFTENYEEEVFRLSPLAKKFGHRILSKSLDARGANRGRIPQEIYRVEVLESEEDRFSELKESFHPRPPFKKMPIIIGAGPAGLFCALRFSEYGIPCHIIERGSRAHERMKFISRYWRYGELNQDDNVCFGEGGAGLFSDGKLITRIKSPYVKYVMQKFVDFGAPPETAYLANPHLGSNKIRGLINKMTDYLLERGHKISYNTRVEDLIVDDNNHLKGVLTAKGESFFSDHIILATGHSAQNIYQQLAKKKVALEAKDFALGVRIEHPRKVIDRAQYGDFAEDDRLGAARYRLSFFDKNTQRGRYSFCMCPGGYVLSSGTEPDGIVVNGMSNYARNSPWSNSALVVTVKAGSDFKREHPLSGEEFQKKIEQKAFELSKLKASGKELPAQRVRDFLRGDLSADLPTSSAPSKIFSVQMSEIFPAFILDHLKNALANFEKSLPGFLGPEAVLIAPETRTSAPITISRDSKTLVSLSHQGLYPCGEGAGYAGGITSAAVDGIRVCESILKDQASKAQG